MSALVVSLKFKEIILLKHFVTDGKLMSHLKRLKKI